MGITACRLCLAKQREIDELKEQVKGLKRKLRLLERKDKDGFLGSSTPSSKKPVKPNAQEREKKPKGARPGHQGNGRKSNEAQDVDRVVEVPPESESCPGCGNPLKKKGIEERSVLDTPYTKPRWILFRLPKRYCPHGRWSFTPQAPGVLPKSLFGNQLIANAVVMYYVNGLPMGRICQDLGISDGSVTQVFRRIARLFRGVPDKLIKQYRQAPVKHADETGWRTNGRNGYAWLFATPDMSIFQFGKSRSAQVPLAVFGPDGLPALVMGLHGQPIEDKEFYTRAAQLRTEIKSAMSQPANHAGIRRIQDIFTNHEPRMYMWADERAVPADNNLAERDLRPSVIARKVSFGSVTDAGAKVRSTLTTITTTLRKQGIDPARQIKITLDALAADPELDPLTLLFPRAGPEQNTSTNLTSPSNLKNQDKKNRSQWAVPCRE